MFIINNEINNYPFTANSTLVIGDADYTLPQDLLVDACVYPRCENDAPFHVSRIDKWVWTVSTNSGEYAFTIAFPEEPLSQLTEYYIGLCYDSIGPCGTVLGTMNLYNWLRAVPVSQELSLNSMIFTASAVRPLGYKIKKKALYVQRGENQLPVVSVSWGGEIAVSIDETDSSSAEGEDTTPIEEGTIVEKIEYQQVGKETPIHTLIINGERITVRESSSESSEEEEPTVSGTVNIVSAPGSKVRVLTRNDISIGKVTEI